MTNNNNQENKVKTKEYTAKRSFVVGGVIAKAGEKVELTEKQAKLVKDYIK